MTAPVNLIVDFLFVEVISAPTVQSLKKESSLSSSRFASRAFAQVFGGATDAVRKVSAISKTRAKTTCPPLPLSTVGRESRKSESWTDIASITTTRVIPPRTREAHDEAMECANDVIEDAKSRQDRRLAQMQSRHEVFATRSSKSIRSRQTQKSQASPSVGSRGSTFFFSSSLSGSRSRVGNGNGSGNGHVDHADAAVDVDPIFRQLTEDINQQRKLLKRSQQEAFDNLWGYVCHDLPLLLSLSPDLRPDSFTLQDRSHG